MIAARLAEVNRCAAVWMPKAAAVEKTPRNRSSGSACRTAASVMSPASAPAGNSTIAVPANCAAAVAKGRP